MNSFYTLRVTWLEKMHEDARCPKMKKKLNTKISYYKQKIQESGTLSSFF